MAHTVDRLERKMLFNKPLLIDSPSFESITEYLATRPDGLMTSEELAVARDIRSSNKKMNLGEGRTALISVSGALTYEETMLGAWCGMSSYQGIINRMEQAVEEGYKTVVLDVDSGGGEAYGCFETAKELKKLAEENDIKLIAYVDGMSASAAYGLTVAASEVIVNPQAEVGSIGVLTRLVNDSKKQKKEGLSTTYIYAGDSKIPFNAEGEWREDFLSDLQTKVDTLYDGFVSHVASMRGISEDVIRETQAKVFSAEDSLEMGLIDSVMERMDFAEYLADIEEGKQVPLKTRTLTKEKEKQTMTKEVVESPTLETPAEAPEASVESTKMAELEKQLATLLAANEALVLEAKAKETATLLAAVSKFSFIDNASEMTDVLSKLEKGDQDSILAAFTKSEAIVNEAVSETLSVEGEEEPQLDGDVDKAKEALSLAITKKFQAEGNK